MMIEWISINLRTFKRYNLGFDAMLDPVWSNARLESGKPDCLCGLWRSRGQWQHEWVSGELQDWHRSNAAWPPLECHCWCNGGIHFGLCVMNTLVLMLQAHPRPDCVASSSLLFGCSLMDELNEQPRPCFPSWYWEGGWSRWRSFCWALGNGICQCLLKLLEAPRTIWAVSLHKLYYLRQWCCALVKRTPLPRL